MYKEWVIMKFFKEKCIAYSKEEGQWRDLNVGGWMNGWMDGVVEDMRKMGIQRWWMTAGD
jgi:hypothetical protein